MRSCFRRFQSLVIALALTGPILASEPQWVEVHSPNFSVITDAGEKRGREVAMRFEQMRAVFGTLLTMSKVNLPIPLQIVAFRNTRELRQVAPLFNGKPTELGGLFQENNDRCFIVLDMSVEDPWRVVFHEYAHQLMNGNMPGGFDPWFEEGFAEYFSSIEVDGKEVRVGKIPHDTYVILQQLGMMKIADLFRVQKNSPTYNESGNRRNTFYAESGILTHYIYDNQLLPKVQVYFELSENQRLPVEEAVQQAFGMKPAKFDDALRSYVNSQHYKYYALPNPASMSSNTYSVKTLGSADASAVVADIHLHSQDYQEQALAEFQEILKSDPKNAAACRGLGYAYLQKRHFAQAAEYFHRASELDAKDPRVHYYNALLMMREGQLVAPAAASAMAKELETAISLDPNFADSYALLAFAESTAGETAKALLTMRKALEISPRNENYLFNLASLYLANGQPDPAIAVLQSLRDARNPALMARVDAMLSQAQQVKAYTATEAHATPMTRPETVREDDETDQPVTASAVAVKPRTARFLQGTLTHADCTTPPAALLTIVSGPKTWKLSVTNRDHMILIGADSFSCSWSKLKVAVNYVETAEGEGSVISLEVQ